MVAGGGASVIYSDTVLLVCTVIIVLLKAHFMNICYGAFLSFRHSDALINLLGDRCLYDWNFVSQVGDLGFASELGNYAEYSGAPNEEETLHFARALIDVSSFITYMKPPSPLVWAMTSSKSVSQRKSI